MGTVRALLSRVALLAALLVAGRALAAQDPAPIQDRRLFHSGIEVTSIIATATP
jgi:hypothetical protein